MITRLWRCKPSAYEKTTSKPQRDKPLTRNTWRDEKAVLSRIYQDFLEIQKKKKKPQNKKMDKRFRHFSKGDIWVLEKVHKKVLRINREMQMNITPVIFTFRTPAPKGRLKRDYTKW